MDMARDLAHGDPWRESMERSLARRRRSGRPSPGAEPARPDVVPSYWLLCWRCARQHGLTLVAAGAGILSLVLLGAVHPSVSDGQSVQAAIARPRVAHRSTDRVATTASSAGPCASRSSGYYNPLASAAVTPKRIDQGVDYAGSGTLSALGDGVVTEVAMAATGWPGAFIEYQLRSGPEAGCYVFYAEGLAPAPGLRAGAAVRRGQAIAVLDPTNPAGVEIGWGAGDGTRTYAGKAGQWSAGAENENIPTSAGLSFSALIAKLGGPPGKIERRSQIARAGHN